MEEIKVTWRLAWGLWWKMVLITLGIYVIIGGIIFAVVAPTLGALLPQMWPMFGWW